jgi:hypothetical protein
MTTLWLLIGLAAICLSILGLLFCVGGIIALWRVVGRVEAVGKAAFVGADEAFALVDTTLDRARRVLERSRRQVSGIAATVGRLTSVEAGEWSAYEPLLQSLDAVFQELEVAEFWLDSGFALAKGVSAVSEEVVSSKVAAAHEESLGVAMSRRVREVSESVAEVIARLQAVREEIVGLHRTGKLVREVVMKVVAWLADLDGMIASISARLEKLDSKVADTKASIDRLRRRLRWWTAFAAIALTVFMTWFGISQISMMERGWRLVHDRPATGSSTSAHRPAKG